jgi:hypothetical protein
MATLEVSLEMESTLVGTSENPSWGYSYMAALVGTSEMVSTMARASDNTDWLVFSWLADLSGGSGRTGSV